MPAFFYSRLSGGIAVAVLCAWVVAFMVGIFKPTYHAPAGLDELMNLVAGLAFAQRVSEQRQKQFKRPQDSDHRDIERRKPDEWMD